MKKVEDDSGKQETVANNRSTETHQDQWYASAVAHLRRRSARTHANTERCGQTCEDRKLDEHKQRMIDYAKHHKDTP